VERGRFRACDPDAARNLLFGAARLAQSEILVGRAQADHVVDLVALILAAYGLDGDEAAQVSRAAAAEVRRLAHYSPVM
jgi:hypothetical protein